MKGIEREGIKKSQEIGIDNWMIISFSFECLKLNKVMN